MTNKLNGLTPRTILIDEVMGEDRHLPCYNCGHTLKDHRMHYNFEGIKTSRISPGAIRSAVMPKGSAEWECTMMFCECWEWHEMGNLEYTAWKKYGNLLFVMRRHGKI